MCHVPRLPVRRARFAKVAPRLASAGARVIVPYLRGYGPTRLLSADTPRSGEQAALASDLLALLDALAIPKAVVGGYDWGGRGCCIVSALARVGTGVFVTLLVIHTVSGYLRRPESCQA